MKKFLSVLLLISLLLVSMISCNNVEKPQNNPSDITEEETTIKRKNTDVPIEYDTESIVNANGDKSIEFSVKGKKYKYKENNLLILLVKNNTDTNYSVSVSVDFLDSTGKTLKSETQTFEGFAAGYESFFAFEPGIPFDNYTYKINVEEFTGECYTKDVDIWFGGLHEIVFPIIDRVAELKDFTKYPSIIARRCYKSTNISSSFLDTSYKFIIIDNTGEVYFTGRGGARVQPYVEISNMEILYQVLEDTIIWPENLTGDVIGICAMEFAKPPENPFQTNGEAEE